MVWASYNIAHVLCLRVTTICFHWLLQYIIDDCVLIQKNFMIVLFKCLGIAKVYQLPIFFTQYY